MFKVPGVLKLHIPVYTRILLRTAGIDIALVFADFAISTKYHYALNHLLTVIGDFLSFLRFIFDM
jgi:hypothetical protein